MFQIFYGRFKVWFWLALSLLLASGAVSKVMRGSPQWEVLLNGGTAAVCFIVFLVIGRKESRKRKEDEQD